MTYDHSHMVQDKPLEVRGKFDGSVKDGFLGLYYCRGIIALWIGTQTAGPSEVSIDLEASDAVELGKRLIRAGIGRSVKITIEL